MFTLRTNNPGFMLQSYLVEFSKLNNLIVRLTVKQDNRKSLIGVFLKS